MRGRGNNGRMERWRDGDDGDGDGEMTEIEGEGITKSSTNIKKREGERGG